MKYVCSHFSLRRALLRWDSVTALLTLAILVTLTLGYRTKYPPEVPFHDIYAQATAYRIDDVTVVEYDRTFSVDYDFTGIVTRLVECEGIRTFDIAGISRIFKQGQHTTQRTFSVPFRYPEDTECKLRTFIAWQPMGSFRESVHEIVAVDFKVIVAPTERK